MFMIIMIIVVLIFTMYICTKSVKIIKNNGVVPT
jgi:hypothetical protein